MNLITRLAGSLVILAIVLITVEIGSYILVEFVVYEKARYLLYEVPNFDEAKVNDYLKIRDPLLGWPTEKALADKGYDSSGSRPVPAFPRPGNECITLYGDSFTYGTGVLDQDTWGNILSERNRCRVGNFGVPGYGTDQALLRFQKNIGDTAPVSILGIYPTDITRNVNQYRYLLTTRPNTVFAFKPRFILERGRLRLVPLPTPSFSGQHAPGSNVLDSLHHETFLPGKGVGPVPIRFPYSLVVWDLFLHERVQGWVKNKPSWEGMIQQDHASEALDVTVAVVKAFMAECDKRGKKCFVITFPTPGGYKKFKKSGISSLEPLFGRLTKLGIPYLTFESYLVAQIGERSICELLTNIRGCTGHFNAKGNKLIAEFVNSYLTDNSMLHKANANESESSKFP